MFKRIGILSLFLFIFTGLTACSGDNPATTDKPTHKTESKEKGPEEKAEALEEPIEPDTEEIQVIVEDTIQNILEPPMTEVTRFLGIKHT